MSENERVHFKIALPVDLKKRLEHQAVESRRSLSAEIIARLEASLSQRPADEDPLRSLSPKEQELMRGIIDEQARVLAQYIKTLEKTRE